MDRGVRARAHVPSSDPAAIAKAVAELPGGKHELALVLVAAQAAPDPAALVRHLVDLHGGSVRAASAGTGRGATFTVKLGKYAAELTSRRAGQWADMEVPLRDFSFEGTPLLPTDPVDGIRFSVSFEKRSGQLDIDGVQFVRRGR